MRSPYCNILPSCTGKTAYSPPRCADFNLIDEDPALIGRDSPPYKDENPPFLPASIVDPNNGLTYSCGSLIGRGGFAWVYEFKCGPNHVYAGKVVPKSRLTKPHHREKVLREIGIHQRLVHKNIVRLYSWFEDKNNVYMVLEYCHNQSLVQLLKERGKLPEVEASCLFSQFLDGVRYLHDCSILHRDLKLGNILLTADMQVKICDFGMALQIPKHGIIPVSICGTPNYLSPEILTNRGHSFATESWAIGCVLYAMLVGKPPFETNHVEETYKRIRNVHYEAPHMLSPCAQNLIIRLLHPDGSHRPTAAEARRHPFNDIGVFHYGISASTATNSYSTPAHSGRQNHRPKNTTAILQQTTSPTKIRQQMSPYTYRGECVVEKQHSPTSAPSRAAHVFILTPPTTPQKHLRSGTEQLPHDSPRPVADHGNVHASNFTISPTPGSGCHTQYSTSPYGTVHLLTPVILQPVNRQVWTSPTYASSNGTIHGAGYPNTASVPKTRNGSFSSNRRQSSASAKENHLPAQAPLASFSITLSSGPSSPASSNSRSDPAIGIDIINSNSNFDSSTRSHSNCGLADAKVDHKCYISSTENCLVSNSTTCDIGSVNWENEALVLGRRLYHELLSCLSSTDSRDGAHCVSIPVLCIDKWVDYTNRHGFGYQYNDGSIGIWFKDGSSLCLSSNKRVYCFRYPGSDRYAIKFDSNSVPTKELKDAVTLLHSFSSYMDQNLIAGADVPCAISSLDDIPHILRWFRYDRCIAILLSNGTLQVNVFDDHTKIVLSRAVCGSGCKEAYFVTIINPNRHGETYPLEAITELFSSRPNVLRNIELAYKMLKQFLCVD